MDLDLFVYARRLQDASLFLPFVEYLIFPWVYKCFMLFYGFVKFSY